MLGPIVDPQSKMSLIEEGGIGTIRLRPRRIDDTDCWLATAVRGKHCAGGIPLAIADALIREGNVTWGDTVDIYGTGRFLQDVGLKDTAAAVHHANPVIVCVEKIEGRPKRKQLTEPAIITPVALFKDEASSETPRRIHRFLRMRDGNLGYTFVQCAAKHHDDDTTLDDAGRWIETYAKSHGGA